MIHCIAGNVLFRQCKLDLSGPLCFMNPGTCGQSHTKPSSKQRDTTCFNVRESADLRAKSHDVQSCPSCLFHQPLTCSTSSVKTCFAKSWTNVFYIGSSRTLWLTWLAGPGRLFRHEPQHSASACAAQLCGAPGKVA